jgi:hypothetical protein
VISEDASGNTSDVPSVAGGYPPGAANVPLPTAPASQPHKRHLFRNIILTVLGIVVLGFVGILALGFYVQHQKAAATPVVAQATTSGSPAPSSGTSAPSAPDLGIPLYPGSTLTSAGVRTTVTSTGTEVAASYNTPDAPSVVAQYYQQQLGDGVQVITLPDAVMMSMGVTGNATSVIVVANNGNTVISIDHGHTTGQ